MPTDNYQKYLNSLRKNPASLVFVRLDGNGHFNSFDTDAVLVAGKTGLKLINVGGHQTIRVTQQHLDDLRQADFSVVVVD